MKVLEARYVKSAMWPDQYPKDGRPECAFVGRSNVGKSSLLNRLLNRKGLAKTSGTPGKTRTLNFFDINGTCYFVDLPGYGYAKVPLQMKQTWDAAMLTYLRTREPLRLVVQILDARHKPSERDHEMLELLDSLERTTLLVATKFDKLKASLRANTVKSIRDTLELHEDALVVPFSAVTGEGLRVIWRVIEESLAG